MWRDSFGRFFQQNPAFLVGMIFLWSTAWALSPSWELILPLPFLVWLFKGHMFCLEPLKQWIWPLIILFVLVFVYLKITYVLPHVSETTMTGKAQIVITNISEKQAYKGKGRVYQARIKAFIPQGSSKSILKGGDCTFYITSSRQQHSADYSYWVEGSLEERSKGSYVLKLDKTTTFKAIKREFNLVEWRFSQKQHVKKQLEKVIINKRAKKFLTGLATGEFDYALMKYTFSRFGLQHILAISGFHFAIISLVLNFLLRPFTSFKVRKILLIFLLSTYFIFIGSAPSIQRSWIMLMVLLIGSVSEKLSFSLNSLGLSLIGVLLCCPLMIFNLGFQFSFLVTAAILLYYSTIDHKMSLYWKKMSFLRKAVSLGLSVHLAAVIVSLYHFHVFYLMGFFLNLIFPFGAACSLTLLIIACIVSVLHAGLGMWIHQLNAYWTEYLLAGVFRIPSSLDYRLFIPTIPVFVMILYVSIMLFIGIAFKERSQNSYAGMLQIV